MIQINYFSMSEQETTQSDAVETTSVNVEATESTAPTTPASLQKSMWVKYIVPIGVVAIILLVVLYLMEKEGRSNTTIFADIIAAQESNATVAVVNGQKIINSELDTSVQQFTQVAVAQGIDTTTQAAQEEIRGQALEVLINTELLKQSAAERGHSVSDEDVTNRIAEIETELGGAETLADRMETLGISDKQLREDVHDELLIQLLLDDIFAEANIEVTQEEIEQVYSIAGGEDAGLPTLDEVTEQVREQIIASKEQEAIDGFLSGLRDNAEIELK
tara:strand:- start:942 stop:1769 length:828 start_codon:yes stop_codon:yes gene_type:complete